MSGFYENIQSKTYQGHVHIFEFQDSLQGWLAILTENNIVKELIFMEKHHFNILKYTLCSNLFEK